MNILDEIMKFEGLNPFYAEGQLRALEEELNNEYVSLAYINEKLNNTINHIKGALDNFKTRIQFKNTQKEFLAKLEEARTK